MQVKVIADSISEAGKRITTLELVYPRFIHAEMLRHRVFSRTVESSRAKPIELNIQEVREHPVYPRYITSNQPGMIGKEILDNNVRNDVIHTLEHISASTADYVEYLKDTYNLHKQVLNRYLEPFLNTKEVVTATEWDNFFTLRLADDAEPHIRKLAQMMQQVIRESTPNLIKENQLHLPYISEEERKEYDVETLIKASCARCARCSYKAYDGTTDIEKDEKLFDRLYKGKHFSPMEHVAKPLLEPETIENIRLCGNFKGWIQYRKYIEY